MELKNEGGKYDEYQAIFIGEIIERIKSNLEEAGLSGEKLKDLTGNLAFGVACVIDDTAGIEFDGREINPYLTFLEGENVLLHCGGNSFTHEYVFGVLDEVFAD